MHGVAGFNETVLAKLEWCGQRMGEAMSNAGTARDALLMNYVKTLSHLIDHLTDRNLAHCDIKTGNVLVRHANAKLADHGSIMPLARSIDTSKIVRTAAFAAPELSQGQVHATTAIFSLAILYAVHRSQLDAEEVRQRIEKKRELPRFSSEELRLVLHATAPRAADRPRSAADWTSQLDRGVHRTSPPIPAALFGPAPQLRIGILGTPGSGKTTFLASLAHPQHGFANESWVSFHDRPSAEVIHKLYRIVLKDAGSSSTARTAPEPITFTFRTQRQKWEVTTADYSGETVKLLQSGGAQFAAERDSLIRKLSECNGIIVVLDATSPTDDDYASWSMLFPQLEAAVSQSGKPQPTLAIVFSKMDTFCDPCAAEYESICQSVLDLQHYGAIVSQARQFDRTHLFFVSSLGDIEKEPPLTADDVHPHQILEPWAWCCENSVAAFCDRLQQTASRLQTELDWINQAPRGWISKLIAHRHRVLGFEDIYGNQPEYNVATVRQPAGRMATRPARTCLDRIGAATDAAPNREVRSVCD